MSRYPRWRLRPPHSVPRELFPRMSCNPADDLPSAPPGVYPRDSAKVPSAPPTISRRRPLPTGNHNAVVARDVLAPRNGSPRAALLSRLVREFRETCACAGILAARPWSDYKNLPPRSKYQTHMYNIKFPLLQASPDAYNTPRQ